MRPSTKSCMAQGAGPNGAMTGIGTGCIAVGYGGRISPVLRAITARGSFLGLGSPLSCFTLQRVVYSRSMATNKSYKLPEAVAGRKDLDIRTGDTVRVWQKIEEKGKFRLQAFEGLVMARKHGTEAGATFTVRRVCSGVGIEKVFPLFSPMIDRIEIVKRARVGRAKIYHIREKVSREARRLLRRTSLVNISSVKAEAASSESEVEAGAETKSE
jgi:large subunit ribosomal protein L19